MKYTTTMTILGLLTVSIYAGGSCTTTSSYTTTLMVSNNFPYDFTVELFAYYPPSTGISEYLNYVYPGSPETTPSALIVPDLYYSISSTPNNSNNTSTLVIQEITACGFKYWFTYGGNPYQLTISVNNQQIFNKCVTSNISGSYEGNPADQNITVAEGVGSSSCGGSSS